MVRGPQKAGSLWSSGDMGKGPIGLVHEASGSPQTYVCPGSHRETRTVLGLPILVLPERLAMSRDRGKQH